MKDRIIKILESYIIDKPGETRAFLNPDSIESMSEEIVESFSFEDLEVNGSSSGETGIVLNHPKQGCESVSLIHLPSGKTGYVQIIF